MAFSIGEHTLDDLCSPPSISVALEVVMPATPRLFHAQTHTEYSSLLDFPFLFSFPEKIDD
jgi:hypothetical protein